LGKVKFAVIGIGGIGKAHIRAINNVEEAELVAIAEVNEALGKAAADQLKVDWYKDYREMLEKADVDAVTICTPHFLHAPMTIECAKAGKHVLTEKPMAIRVSECDEMIKAAKKHGVILGVVFQHRTNPYSKALKAFIDRGELGEIYHAVLEYYTLRTQAYYNSGAWRGTWGMEGGGVLINQGVHFIDLYQWFVGVKPVKLSAFIGNLLHDIEVEDLASAIIEFENGAQGVMQLSTLDNPGFNRIVIRGDKSLAIYEGGAPKVAVTTPPIKETITSPTGVKPSHEWKELEPIPGLRGHEAVIKDFAQAVLKGTAPMVPGEEGRKSVEIVNAIIMSGVLRRPVTFPLDREEYDKVHRRLSELKTIPKD